jgi:hypothetical protein
MPNPDIARTTVKSPYYFVNASGHTIEWMLEQNGIDVENIADGKALIQGYDPIQIKYNCDTHVVIPINR